MYAGVNDALLPTIKVNYNIFVSYFPLLFPPFSSYSDHIRPLYALHRQVVHLRNCRPGKKQPSQNGV